MVLKKELEAELVQLKQELEEKDKIIENLKTELIKSNERVHNERGAGRKTRLSDEELATIKMYRFQGKTIREIAELFACSTRTINRMLEKDKINSDGE